MRGPRHVGEGLDRCGNLRGRACCHSPKDLIVGLARSRLLSEDGRRRAQLFTFDSLNYLSKRFPEERPVGLHIGLSFLAFCR